MASPVEPRSNELPVEPTGLCDRVRSSCRVFIEQAHHVSLDESRLRTVARELMVPHAPSWPRRDLVPAEEADATLVFALDAINFGSGYHDVVRKRPSLSGARTMAAALTDYVAATGPLDASRLQSMTEHDCSQIFGQELDGGALEELMTRFGLALNDLGNALADAGGTLALLDRADRSAEGLAELLTDMPYYRDEEEVDGQTVAFYKRAQITPADLCRRFAAELFDDLGRLTAFADNLVPHVLRIDGVIRLERAIVAQIDAGELLAPGERPEVEIRAAGVVAVEGLSDLTGRRAMDLDLALWERGGRPEYKAHRRHRSRTVFY